MAELTFQAMVDDLACDLIVEDILELLRLKAESCTNLKEAETFRTVIRFLEEQYDYT